MDCKSEAAAEIFGPQGKPLPHVRPPPRLYAEVPSLPYLLPRAGVGRKNPRCDEGELVRNLL
jgi:hypothetical protein